MNQFTQGSILARQRRQSKTWYRKRSAIVLFVLVAFIIGMAVGGQMALNGQMKIENELKNRISEMEQQIDDLEKITKKMSWQSV